MITKTEAKKKAKEVLQSAIGCAYYRISDDESISDEDTELILQYITKYGISACKSFGETYVSY